MQTYKYLCHIIYSIVILDIYTAATSYLRIAIIGHPVFTVFTVIQILIRIFKNLDVSGRPVYQQTSTVSLVYFKIFDRNKY